jgi:hypothetical protein
MRPANPLTSAVLKVGEGRSCVANAARAAAHCLPHLPLAHPASFTEEWTYQHLLGPLDV